MYDSLNRHMLPNYGCQWTHAPNFQRLGEKTITFDNFYASSMPCMPARRELHTGRYNFLHRSWGPLEPYDDSMPEILRKNNVYTHLVSDHYHYWEEGGSNYHTKYSSWEISRGQEGDPWKGHVADPVLPDMVENKRVPRSMLRQDFINRSYMKTPESHVQSRTFDLGLEFIENNKDEDQWLLQIETFDPHEPFFTHEKFKALYKHEFDGKHYDWPNYGEVDVTPEELEHLRYEYGALLSMCDEKLGMVLDAMDKHNLWEDTMLIVNTDHGFLLGEKDYLAKCYMPLYNENVHIPFFIWDPRLEIKNERRDALCQTIDIAPTLLEFFDQKIPHNCLGKPLKDILTHNSCIHENGILFGMFRGHLNYTDGRYVYMRAPNESYELFEYTHMPAHMHCHFSIKEMQSMIISPPFKFTKGCPVMKIKHFTEDHHGFLDLRTKLFDLKEDPEQLCPIVNLEIEDNIISQIIKLMKENDAPYELYSRFNLF